MLQVQQKSNERWEGLVLGVGLLMRMSKSFFHMAKYVVLDSGFCVLKGIVKLQEMGLFVSALIKSTRAA